MLPELNHLSLMMPKATAFRKALLGAAICAVLLAVFTLYVRPEFMVSIADQLWSCF